MGTPCPEQGSSCDDNDATTFNDVADGECGCSGTPCPAAGTSCDDGLASTFDDVQDGECNCVGTPCPAAGTTCNDNDATTFNDVADGECGCTGTPCPEQGSSCDDNDPTTENDIADGECGCAGTPCPEAGTACDDGLASTFDDVADGECGCAGTPCPEQGTSCDDNDPTTENDVADGECGCAGTPCPEQGSSCNDNDATTFNDVADGECGCTGTPCPAAGTSCDDGLTSTFDDVQDGECNCVGTPCPTAGTSCDDGDATTFDDVADGECGCAGLPCPAAGTSCNDNDPATFDDVADGTCGCEGTPCPAAGLACDDNDENTLNDQTDGLCGCAGEPINVTPECIQDGLLALYTFETGQGATVEDVSGVAPALDLDMSGSTAWNNGTLEVSGNSIAESQGAASKIISTVKGSNAITIEAWVRAGNTSQSGPARIATISSNTSNRNITLGQDGGTYVGRIRTSGGSNNGMPNLSGGSVNTSALQHVVYTFDAATGEDKLYVDGALVGTSQRNGDLSNWNDSYKIALANELTEDRPWEGGICKVAIYGNALSASVIEEVYQAGCDCDITPPEPTPFDEGEWSLECGEYELEIIGAGAHNANGTTTLNISNPSNVAYVVLETVSKGGSMPTVTYTSQAQGTVVQAGTSFTGGTTGAYGNRAVIVGNPGTSVSMTTNASNVYSFMAYVYRNATGTGTAEAGKYLNRNVYQETASFNLDVPGAGQGTRDVTLRIPVTEMSDDSRIAVFTASLGGQTVSETINTFDPALGSSLTFVELRFENVPGSAAQANLTVDSPNSGGDSFVLGSVSITSERACTNCDTTADCDDGNPCTEDACDNGYCYNIELPDTDGDGACDATDGCPEDPNKTEPGICGCGTPDDANLNGTADCQEEYYCTTGAIALYEFNEGSGATINDVSGVAPAIDLTIDNPNGVAWLNDGTGAYFTGTNIADSDNAGTKIIDAAKASNAITVEAWVMAADNVQEGPARIFTISSNTTNRNITVGQEAGTYAGRIRTTGGTNNGTPSLLGGTVNPNTLQHLVYSFDASTGEDKLFVDGVLVQTGSRNGDLGNWNDGYKVALANEFSMDRSWEGKYCRVAVYDRALDSDEVENNFEAGCNCDEEPSDCAPAGTPCDDGNSLTEGDSEDGDCNCAGFEVPECAGVPGALFHETFNNISGNDLGGLLEANNYPNSPDDYGLLTSFYFDGSADNYGSRVRGYIFVTESGNYEFNVTGDDDVRLFLSSDSNPGNMELVAEINGWTHIDEHDKYASQTSASVYLERGGFYYVELLHKEGGGGDHFAVHWRTNGTGAWAVIGEDNIYPFECYDICPAEGTPCDDGDPFTSDDQYDADCNCVGTPDITSCPIGEAGSITFTQNNRNHWETITLTRSYNEPVVVAKFATQNGSDEAVVAVRNITGNSFQLQMREYSNHDGWHTQETIHYIVVEAGTHELPNGVIIQAGNEQSVRENWRSITFPTAFNATPVVVSQVTTDPDGRALVTRQRNLGSAGFQFRIRSSELKYRTGNALQSNEQIAWIAMAQGTGGSGTDQLFEAAGFGREVRHTYRTYNFVQDFSTAPILLTDMQNHFGGDHSSARVRGLGTDNFQVKIQEERTADNEVNHTREPIGFIAFEEGVIYSTCGEARPDELADESIEMMEGEVVLYPNPAIYDINIKLTAPSLDFERTDYVYIYSETGQRMYYEEITGYAETTLNVDVTGFAPGMYILTYKVGKRFISKQFIVVRD